MKEYWSKIPDKTKKLLIAIIAGTIIIAAGAITVLRLTNRTEYATLFTGMNQEDAQKVAGLLQDSGVTYQYDDTSGTIRVPSGQVDQTRANLLQQGYPQSGFTYDMYIDHAGLMTTESDKRQYTRYELQDRLGAQIRLFDKVQDARVTISEGDTQRYALGDDESVDASASVVVTMKNGESLTESQAAAVKNLVARAVRGMNFTNVSVFDADTMLEVGGENGTDVSEDGTSLAALTSLVETNIASNIRRVLEKLYGQGNVAVSVKGTLNMEQLIQESIQYTVPEKIDDEDKDGLLEKESGAAEGSGADGEADGDVVGADANADTPRYTTQNGNDDGLNGYYSNNYSREWLYNSLKEQRQISPGVLEDLSVAVVINTDDLDVSQQDLVNLVANAAGIIRTEANQKISIIRSLSPEQKTAADQPVTPVPVITETRIPLPLLIGLIALGVLVLLLLIFLLLRRRKKKAEAELDEELSSLDGYVPVAEDGGAPDVSGDNVFAAEDEEMENNEEILNLRMQRSMKLKQNIGDFVDQNPQIAAKLLQGWLRGEGGGGDG